MRGSTVCRARILSMRELKQENTIATARCVSKLSETAVSRLLSLQLLKDVCDENLVLHAKQFSDSLGDPALHSFPLHGSQIELRIKLLWKFHRFQELALFAVRASNKVRAQQGSTISATQQFEKCGLSLKLEVPVQQGLGRLTLKTVHPAQQILL